MELSDDRAYLEPPNNEVTVVLECFLRWIHYKKFKLKN